MKITSRHGLIVGSIFGLIASAIAVYYLIPIFEKSEENAANIIEISATLDETKQQHEETTKQLESINEELTGSRTRVEELEPLQGQLTEANDQIGSLKSETEKNSSQISQLQQQIEDKNLNIQSLESRTSDLEQTISEREDDISLRSEWIQELKRRDDEIVRSAMHLVENFMKISVESDNKGSTSVTRGELFSETLSLVNKLDGQRNTRKLFIEEMDKTLP